MENFKYTCALKCSMVIKSLTITENAYDALSLFKRAGESFSEVILRITRDKTSAMDKYFGILSITDDDSSEWKKQIKIQRATVDKDAVERQKRLANHWRT